MQFLISYLVLQAAEREKSGNLQSEVEDLTSELETKQEALDTLEANFNEKVEELNIARRAVSSVWKIRNDVTFVVLQTHIFASFFLSEPSGGCKSQRPRFEYQNQGEQ